VRDDVIGCGDLAISPDGRHAYLLGGVATGVSVFAREPAGGRLQFLDRLDDITGRGAVFDPQGRHLYLGYSGQIPLRVFERDSGSGGLVVIQEPADPVLLTVSRVTVSPDGTLVYALATPVPNDGILGIYRRDPLTGRVTREQLIESVIELALSPDGAHAYLVRGLTGAVDLYAVAD
jgi:6-phosphogluconolactonase (cycloisomerase 2 family)